MKENLVIVFGGKSVEHDISIITALQTMKYIGKEYNVVPVYVDRDGKWCTADNLDKVDTFIEFEKEVCHRREVAIIPGDDRLYVKKIGGFKPIMKIDAALMCLHGGAGEDGSIASVFAMSNIPFTSSGHASSAICMDKIFTKLVLDGAGIDNVEFCYLTKKDFEENTKGRLKKVKALGFPVIIKPANLGSSIAINIARNIDDFEEMVKLALEFDERVLIEKFIEDCEEYNCACMTIEDEITSSKVIKVDKGEIFSFEEKYLENGIQKSQKSKKNIENAIKKLTKQIYSILNCRGVVRVDYLVKDDKILVNEVNTIPGSLSVHMFSGGSKRELVDNLIQEARRGFNEKKRLTTNFKSDALSIFQSAIDMAKSKKQ